MKLACQEHLLPGSTLAAKWDMAQRLGFEGIELLGRGGLALEARLPELRAAKADGAVFSSVCVAMGNFIGDLDPAAREDAKTNLASQLTVIAELGGLGVVTPTSFGKATNALPPLKSPLTKDEQRQIVLDAAGELGAHARSAGSVLLLEPLNRYETNFMHKLATAAEICRTLGMPSVKVMGDLYHMNIEEDDPPRSIRDHADVLAHIHACDSNRSQPGMGHVDFVATGAALRDIGYDGWLAFECGLRGEPQAALRDAAALVRATLH